MCGKYDYSVVNIQRALVSSSRIVEYHDFIRFFSTTNLSSQHQIMSNDKYTSVEHRVVMNTREEPRVSSGIFFSPGKRGDSVFYGPLAELVSSEDPVQELYHVRALWGLLLSRPCEQSST